MNTPAPQVEMVSDEMVEIGCVAAVEATGFNVANWPDKYPDAAQLRKVIRAAIQSALNARAGGDGPHWTHDKPTTTGVFGVRGYQLGVDAIDQFESVVLVRRNDDDELVCNLHECTSNENIDDWSLVADFSSRFEWCRFEYAALASQAVGVKDGR